MNDQVMIFLGALADNNSKEWFDAHRDEYELIKKETTALAEKLLAGLNQLDPTLGLTDARKCIFRINRDVRFSADKSPYKTHIGMFFNKGGKSKPTAGYYLHIEPGKSFAGGGIYGPPAEELNAIRREIYFNSAEFEQIIGHREFRNTFGTLMDEGKLQRPPKGYPADFPAIELLKYKHYVVGHNLSDAQLSASGSVEYILQIFSRMKGFNLFLNRALEMAM